MGILKKSILILLFSTVSSFCFAKQITVQIVQHNLETQKISDSSLLVEDEILNGFFDYGFIVTNTPPSVSVSQNEDVKLYNLGMGDASEGYSDYFVQVKLFYEKDEAKRKFSLMKIDWTLASAVTGNKIKESSINSTIGAVNTDDLKLLTSSLIKDIKKAIKA